VGSGSVAAISTGIWAVIQTSWNAAVPMSSVFGVGASESTTDLPDASWPVTIRRGAALIGPHFGRRTCSSPRADLCLWRGSVRGAARAS
jgi:hypothetical protein